MHVVAMIIVAKLSQAMFKIGREPFCFTRLTEDMASAMRNGTRTVVIWTAMMGFLGGGFHVAQVGGHTSQVRQRKRQQMSRGSRALVDHEGQANLS